MATTAGHVQPVLPVIMKRSTYRGFTSSSLPRTSLPPLPVYPTVERHRPRWGEDILMERSGFDVMSSGFAKLRNNYDNCHPVCESTPAKYDGYMFPKPLYPDLGALYSPAMSTCRKVPRNRGCQVFPRNDPSRQADDVYLLCPSTRNALADYTDHLYKETSFNTHFKDRSDFMARMLRRDQQFRAVCATHLPETSTCCRVLNHPDPCTYCWTGLNHDSTGGSTMHTFNHSIGTNKAHPRHCPAGCRHESACCHGNTVKQELEETSVYQTCPKETDGGGRDLVTTSNIKEQETYDHSDLFGPWSNNFKMSEDDEKQSLPRNNHFRHPSPMHCWTTENELDSSFIERQDPRALDTSQNKTNFFGPSTEMTSLLPLRNTFTFRDGNNLRIPCISAVLGNSSKAEFHRRYHQGHPDPIPDLRDNMKSSKRVTFFGYNSSVYR